MADAVTSPVPARPLWRNFSFQVLWTSVAAAGFGDRLIQMAAWSLLGYYLATAQGASIQACASFFFFLPYVLFGVVAGWLADTFPRKWILVGCDFTRGAILIAAIALVPAGAAVAMPESEHWRVWLLVAATGTLAAVFSPAKAAVVPQIVPVQQLQPANAIVLAIAAIASMIGLVVGDPVVRKHSVHAGLALGAAAYFLSGAALVFMRVPRHDRSTTAPRQSQARRMIDAAVYTLRHRAILNLTLLTVVFWGAAYVLLAGIAALCKNHYRDPAADAPTMMAVLGVGMMASSGWVAWLNTRRESSWFAMLTLMTCGIGTGVLAYNESYKFGLAAAFAVGFFGNAAMIVVATLTQSIAPDYIRGRVFGVRDLANMASAVVINFIIWRMPDADHRMIPVLYFMGGLLIVIGLGGALRELFTGPLPTPSTRLIWRVDRAFVLVWHRLTWNGRHRVPSAGPVILASNHTTALDPFLIQAALPRLIRWLMIDKYYLRILMPLWNAIDPIVMHADEPRTVSLRRTLRVLEQGGIVGVFPEGGLQRTTRELRPFGPGIGLLAQRSGAWIVPIWIDGTPRTADIVTHFLKPSRSRVRFGKPYKPDPNWSHQQVADDLKQRMVALSGVGHGAAA